ncbi:hypothetical protein J6590_100526, partial [Homalodisca vitripennis]
YWLEIEEREGNMRPALHRLDVNVCSADTFTISGEVAVFLRAIGYKTTHFFVSFVNIF